MLEEYSNGNHCYGVVLQVCVVSHLLDNNGGMLHILVVVFSCPSVIEMGRYMLLRVLMWYWHSLSREPEREQYFVCAVSICIWTELTTLSHMSKKKIFAVLRNLF